MGTLRNLGLCMLLSLPVSALAQGCADVVADTVAEMKAGADGWWSDDVEGLVRSAAGSACVKAHSGRYAQSTAAERDAGELTTRAVAPLAEKSAASMPAADETASSGKSGATEERGTLSLGGLTIRSRSDSPGNKPDERQRETRDESGDGC